MNLKLIKNIFMGTVVLLILVFVIWLSLEDSDVVSSTKESAAVSFGLAITYLLMAIAVLVILFMAVRGFINNPKSAMYIGAGVVVFLILFGIFYAMDGGEVNDTYIKNGIETAGASKMIGGALNATFAILIISVAASVFASVKDIFNKK